MADGSAAHEEFERYLRVRLFGLVAVVDRPSASENFPIASGIIIETEGAFVLLTAAHYLADVARWKEQGRLHQLSLIVHHESGICAAIPLEMDRTFCTFCNGIDFGFVLLDADVLAGVEKHGGKVIRRDNLNTPPEAIKSFFLVGHASAHCPMSTEIIATSQEGSTQIAWRLTKPSGFAVAISRLLFDGGGTEPGTLRFVPVKGFGDYSGTSGGPIIGYTEGALIRDYCLVGIQSRQILAGTKEQKPIHLIATSAVLVVHLVDERLRELSTSVD
jgi:hypothetical protein